MRILGICSVKKTSETSRIHIYIGKCTKYIHAWGMGLINFGVCPNPAIVGK